MTTDEAKEIGKRVAQHVQDDDMPGMAAQLAYRFLFAVFPFGLFVAALGAFVATWLGVQNPAQQIVNALGDNLPPDIATTIRPELERVINNTRPGLLSFGALAALWAATGGTNALIKAMNRAYDVEEGRSFLVRYLTAAGLTILASTGILVSFVTIVGGALLTQQLAEEIGFTSGVYAVLSILRWPAVFLLLVAAVAILFRLAPNIKTPWKWTLAGGALFTIVWLIATAGLAFYIGNVANYGATYGSLGGVIVLMLWFYITGLALVGAAEVTAAAASVLEPDAVREQRDANERQRQAKELVGEAKAKAEGPIGRLKGALGFTDSEESNADRSPGRPDGPERHERRRGPRDRRRAGWQQQPRPR